MLPYPPLSARFYACYADYCVAQHGAHNPVPFTHGAQYGAPVTSLVTSRAFSSVLFSFVTVCVSSDNSMCSIGVPCVSPVCCVILFPMCRVRASLITVNLLLLLHQSILVSNEIYFFPMTSCYSPYTWVGRSFYTPPPASVERSKRRKGFERRLV